MPAQTKMNSDPGKKYPERRLRKNVSALIHDLIELVELQFLLLVVDLKEAVSRMRVTGIFLATGFCLLLGLFPVMLSGIGYVLHQQLEWSLGGSLILVSSLALVVSGLLIFVGMHWSREALTTLKRSQEELTSNIRWVKHALADDDQRAEQRTQSNGRTRV